jgi:hypothetical protein
MTRMMARTLMAVIAIAGAARAGGRCSKDGECKGTRTCVKRKCVAPVAASLPPKAEPAVASTQAPKATDWRPAMASLPLPVPAGAASAVYRPAPASSLSAQPASASMLSAQPPSSSTLSAEPAPSSTLSTQPAPSSTLSAQAASSLLSGGVTAAPVKDSTRHRHLGGYFRPDLGFGYLTTAASQNGSDVSIGGLGETFGIAVGGAVSENSILAVHLWDAEANDPELSANGTTISTTDSSLSLMGVGPEYTYYTAQNFYFSLSPSLTHISTSSGSQSGESDWGLGLRAAVGKEWWVSDHWGMGLAGHLSMSTNQDSVADGPTWSSWAFSVAFSATYN